MRWTRKTIVAEIKRLHSTGTQLNYATAEDDHLNLVRASAWHFGTWRRAVEAAGIEYESISKYQRWSRARIIERIRELHHEGADLNWRAVSLEVDPPLAAAALRTNGFSSWREAIEAAGLDINGVARYKVWDEKRVLKEIKAMHRAGEPLSSKAVQLANQPLFCAARRRFGSWDEALVATGLSVQKIRLRQASDDRAPRNSLNGAAKNGIVGKSGKSGAGKTEASKVSASRATAATSKTQSGAAKSPTARKSVVTPTKATRATALNSTAKKGAPVGKASSASAAKAAASTLSLRATKPGAAKKPASKAIASKPVAPKVTAPKVTATRATSAKSAAKATAGKAGAGKVTASKTAAKKSAAKSGAKRR